MEFFAVCTEHFFETPKLFKQNLPILYNLMCYMLNQDPDYIYSQLDKNYYKYASSYRKF